MSSTSKREVALGGELPARPAAPLPMDGAGPVDEFIPTIVERKAATSVSLNPSGVRRLAAVAAPVAGADTLGHLPIREKVAAPRRFSVTPRLSPPIVAGLVFGLCGMVAAATVQHTLASFAQEGGASPLVFLAVPGLFAALFAILVYQGAGQKLTSMAQSFSRALLVALLTWASFSALATSVWCKPELYGQCYGSFLIVSGLIGGGPMLLAAGAAGAIVGWWVLKQRH